MLLLQRSQDHDEIDYHKMNQQARCTVQKRGSTGRDTGKTSASTVLQEYP